MKKKNPNQLPIIPIGLSVCFLGIITFLFLHFSTSGSTGGFDDLSPSPPAGESPNPDEIHGGHGTPASYIQVGIALNIEDINTGSLVLVDKDHRYDLKETDLDLVLVNDAKTVPFQMRQGYVTKLCRSVIEPLDEMMQAYIDEVGENTVYIYIGYRDEADQQKTLDDFIATIGRSAAMQRVALPGFSEHHTGLAMDIGALVDGVHHTFDYRADNYHAPTRWFALNSYRFGFVLSFPEDRAVEGESIYEPWHYRYVGYPHSHIMFENNWSLSEYLTQLRGYTLDRPFKVEYDDSYEIFFTTETTIEFRLPGIVVSDTDDEYTKDALDALFKEFIGTVTTSGNNVDGCIVTIKK